MPAANGCSYVVQRLDDGRPTSPRASKPDSGTRVSAQKPATSSPLGERLRVALLGHNLHHLHHGVVERSFTATAAFAGIVHGVVVHTRVLDAEVSA